MSDKRAQANRYAQAIAQAMLERWQATLAQASTILSQEDGQNPASAIAALESKLSGAPSEVVNLLKLLVQEGDAALIPDISAALGQIVTGQSAPLKADIVSASELSEGAKDQIRRKLSEEHGEGLAFSFRTDASLMGGLRVRVGDRLIDNSVATRLTTLRESLTSVAR